MEMATLKRSPNVRFGSKAVIRPDPRDVRFAPITDIAGIAMRLNPH